MASTADDSSRNCGSCGEHIKHGEALLALGRRWHQDCWQCSTCQLSLVGKSFFALPSRKGALCQHCHETREHACHRCAKKINSSNVICAAGKPYHVQCWTCTGPCGRTLGTADDFFFDDQHPDWPLCEQCFAAKLGQVQCGGCDESVTIPFVKYGTRHYHTACFQCCLCHEALSPTRPSVPNSEGHPLCSACALKPPTCKGCDKVINDPATMLNASGTYHVDCFKCSSCSKRLDPTEDYMEQDQGPVCRECYDQMYAPTCSKCDRKILDESFLSVKGLPLHRKCLDCSQCGKKLSSKEFCRTSSNGVVCGPCTDDGPMTVPEEQTCQVRRASAGMQAIPCPIVPQFNEDMCAAQLVLGQHRFSRASSAASLPPLIEDSQLDLTDHFSRTSSAADDTAAASAESGGFSRHSSSGTLPPLRTRFSRLLEDTNPLENAILDHPTGDVHDFYEFGRALGDGVAGEVFAATHKKTGENVAIKRMSKAKSEKEMDSMRREVQIMWMLQDCEKVVQIVDAFEDYKMVYVVMEYCGGGDLITMLCDETRAEPLSEREVATIMRDVLSVINVCHDFGVIHKDIKPENFLFTHPGSQSALKCTDFGMSVFFEEGKRQSARANPGGTHAYMAPEMACIFAGQEDTFGKEIDIWAAGVMLYTLLSGFFPFDDASNFPRETLFMPVDFDEGFEHVSAEAKKLIRRMLAKKPKDRPTAAELLHDPWIASGSASNAPLGNALVERMKKFARRSMFQRAALRSAAQHLTPDEIAALRNAFQAYDENKDGCISLMELTHVLQCKGEELGKAELEDLVSMLNQSDGGKYINYEEFLGATMTARSMLYEENVSAAFEAFDEDNDGSITKEELTKALSSVGTIKPEHIDQIISEADRDGDGVIDYLEFVRYVRQQKW